MLKISLPTQAWCLTQLHRWYWRHAQTALDGWYDRSHVLRGCYAQETQGLGLQSFYDVIQRVGEERGLMDPDAEEQVCKTHYE